MIDCLRYACTTRVQTTILLIFVITTMIIDFDRQFIEKPSFDPGTDGKLLGFSTGCLINVGNIDALDIFSQHS